MWFDAGTYHELLASEDYYTTDNYTPSRFARIAMLDPDRKILRVAHWPERHLRHPILGRHIVGELAVEAHKMRQDRLADRLPPLLVALDARRQLDRDRQETVA